MMDYSTSLPNGLRVLVVDGDPDTCYLLSAIFDRYSVELAIANSAREAIEQIQDGHPHLLISEIVLPDEDGYSLISKVKAFEKRHRVQIPAIALTTQCREIDRVRALNAGFQKHLPKPFNLKVLISMVADLTVLPHESASRNA